MTQMTKEERANKKEVTRIKSCLEMELKDVQSMHVGPPTYVFKVGDRVRYGAWEWSRVLEVFENGMYYKLMSITKDVKYAEIFGQKMKIHYESWVHIRKWKEPIIKENRFLVGEDRIQFSMLNNDIESLLNKHYHSYAGIDLSPDYQRGNIWTLEQKRDLIKSIFNYIDIGKFSIIKRKYEPGQIYSYEMLDGKQRFIALMEFYENRFTYNGLYFDEMDWRDQNHFKGYMIIISECNPLTKQQKYHYFLKLNTAGKPIDPDHLKKVEELLKKDLT